MIHPHKPKGWPDGELPQPQSAVCADPQPAHNRGSSVCRRVSFVINQEAVGWDRLAPGCNRFLGHGYSPRLSSWEMAPLVFSVIAIVIDVMACRGVLVWLANDFPT